MTFCQGNITESSVTTIYFMFLVHLSQLVQIFVCNCQSLTGYGTPIRRFGLCPKVNHWPLELHWPRNHLKHLIYITGIRTMMLEMGLTRVFLRSVL